MIISSNLIIISQQNHQYNMCFDVWSLAVYPGDQKNQFRLASSSFYEYAGPSVFFSFVFANGCGRTCELCVCVCVCVCVEFVFVFPLIFVCLFVFFYDSFVDFCGNVLRGCVCVMRARVVCSHVACKRAFVIWVGAVFMWWVYFLRWVLFYPPIESMHTPSQRVGRFHCSRGL